MKKIIRKYINYIENKEPIETVGGPKSNWRHKVYPKPKVWVTKETLKSIK